MFGGGYNGTEVGTLYLLDVATMMWTQGPSSQPRKGMACTVSGNFFVVWGGTNNQWRQKILIFLCIECLYIFPFCSNPYTLSFLVYSCESF